MTRLQERLRLQGDVEACKPASDAVSSKPHPLPRAPDDAGRGTGVHDVAHAVVSVRRTLLANSAGLLEIPVDNERLTAAVRDILCQESLVVVGMTREALTAAVVSEIVGFGPLDSLIKDASVTDIMVNCPAEIYCERNGILRRSDCVFRDEAHLRSTVMRILAPLGRRLDNLNPYVDARLADGSRLNVVIPPLATRGWTVTIRRFRQEPMTMEDLADAGLAPPGVFALLRAVVQARLNVLVSGGAGSGKTTLLNAMCMCVPSDSERLITIEDAQEMRILGVHYVSLEARPPNLEGLGEVTIRQLVRNALRMRPDRLIIGEVRDGAAYDFLQAINTGHNGSMCTVHANSAADALYRMENLAITSAANVVLRAVRDQLVAALDLVVHLRRDDDGRRLISEVAVVSGSGDRLEALDLIGQASMDGDPLQELVRRVERRSTRERALVAGRLARRLRGEAM